MEGIASRIAHGEAVGVIGANGAGKSTLVNQLNGFLLPTEGRVVIGDTPVDARTRRDIRRRVGIVFQNPDDQLFLATVGEDVAFGPRNLGLPEQVVAARVRSALELVSAWDLRQRPSHNLSDGQKRAVAIAGVLAMEPDILVMDEPSSTLDPRNRRRIIEFLRGFRHTRIIVSHDLDLVWDVCGRVLLLDAGRLRADGPARDLLRDRPLLEACGLELPLRLQDGAAGAPSAP